FLFITALTGIIMRYTLLSTNQSLIPYSFLLHGHSHIALLGWTFLGVFLIFLKLTWHELNAKNQAIWIVVSTLYITSLMFIAFLFITALTGIIMRYTLLSTNQSLIPYSFLLHGHSHIALLGWTFLGVFLIFLKLTWHELNAKNQAIWIVVSTLFITSLMFIAF